MFFETNLPWKTVLIFNQCCHQLFVEVRCGAWTCDLDDPCMLNRVLDSAFIQASVGLICRNRRGTSPPRILQIHSLHQVANNTPSYVPLWHRGIIITIFHGFGTICMVLLGWQTHFGAQTQDWALQPTECVFCPNSICNLIAESPIFRLWVSWKISEGWVECFLLMTKPRHPPTPPSVLISWLWTVVLAKLIRFFGVLQGLFPRISNYVLWGGTVRSVLLELRRLVSFSVLGHAVCRRVVRPRFLLPVFMANGNPLLVIVKSNYWVTVVLVIPMNFEVPLANNIAKSH